MNLDSDPSQIIDYREQPPEYAVDLRFLSAAIAELMATLTASEQLVLQLRFGFVSSGICYTLEECGRLLRVTRERIRAIESKAIAKLSHKSRSARLKPFRPTCDSQPIGKGILAMPGHSSSSQQYGNFVFGSEGRVFTDSVVK